MNYSNLRYTALLLDLSKQKPLYKIHNKCHKKIVTNDYRNKSIMTSAIEYTFFYLISNIVDNCVNTEFKKFLTRLKL